MEYWVKDEISCPECNEPAIFYDEECLKEWYRCSSCGHDFSNDYLYENTKTFAKNCVPPDIQYSITNGNIWVDSVNTSQYLKISVQKVRSLLKQYLITGYKEKRKWRINWLSIIKYQKTIRYSSNGISVKDAAIKLHKSETTIRNYLRDGKLSGIKYNNRWFVIIEG